MANFEDVFNENQDKLGEAVKGKEGFVSLAGELEKLGYEVLINHKEKAEFVPTSRLAETVAQREAFKGKFEDLNKQLEELKKNSSDSVKTELEKQILENKTLLENMEKEVENTKIQTGILLAARRALDPKDVLAFVDMSKIKITSKGEITGVEEEVQRIEKEKPYLFQKGKAGSDSSSGSSHEESNTMNSLIRMAAGIS